MKILISVVQVRGDEEKMELKIDFRIQGVPQSAAEQENVRTRGVRRVGTSSQKSPEQGCINRRSAEILHEQSLRCNFGNVEYFEYVLIVETIGLKASSTALMGLA